MLTKRILTISLIVLLTAAVLTACGPQAAPATPTLSIPTAVPTSSGAVIGGGSAASPTPQATMAPPPSATPLSTAPPSPTTPALPTAAPLPTLPATAVPTAAAVTYRVAFVSADDELNVRAAAGVANSVVGTLPPDAGQIVLTGADAEVAGSTWVQLRGDSVSGWVNGRFLTQDVPAALFCQDAAVTALLANLQTAVQLQDNALLAQLIHPERGLRVRVNWWNPEILLRGQTREALFASGTSYNWGVQDGSGNPITGSFATVVAPMLRNDLAASTIETACNEILAGSTAGIVRLPAGYEALNYVSVYRPATDAAGFDWGTWAVGIEKWDGRYYLSYLVHYQYEI